MQTSQLTKNFRALTLAAAFVALAAAPALAQNRTNQQGLPPCTLDSFVYHAGASAEEIYGDEGVGGLPPFFGFDQSHRIEQGIPLETKAGLTTGHGSQMPCAWGADEFLQAPGEWCVSGQANTSGYYGVQNQGIDLSAFQAGLNAEYAALLTADDPYSAEITAMRNRLDQEAGKAYARAEDLASY